MNTIETIIQNEYIRLSRSISRLREECIQRPKGSIAMKTRGNARYAYLVKRENGKVVTEYIGKEGSWKVKGAEAKVLERKRYETELKELETEAAKLRRLMKAANVFFVDHDS